MPTYEYRCERCGHTTEVVQSFTDAPLTTCESCSGPLRKVYAPVGIVFKGSGFYKTDSRSSSTTSRSKASAGTDGAGGAERTDTSEKAGKKDGDSTPAKADTAAASPKADGKGTGAPSTPAAPGSSSKKD